MAVTITIAGTNRSSKVHVTGGALSVTRRLAARATCRFTTLDPAASGMYRPAVNDSVTVVDTAVTKFGGVIVEVREGGFVGTAGAVVSVAAADFSSFLDFVRVRETYPAGQTLQQIVSDLVTSYVAAAPYSLTLGSMATSPTLGEVVFDLCTMTEAFAQLATITGWTSWVDFSRVVHWQAGSSGGAAPFSITEASPHYLEGSLEVSQTRTDYRNRQYVRYGSGERFLEEPHTADGVSRDYMLDVPCNRSVPNTVTVGTDPYNVGVYGVDDLPWTYQASTNTVKQRASDPIVPNGTTVTIGYYGLYPAVVSAEDATAIATYGAHDAVRDVPETFSKATAQDYADGDLRRYNKTPPPRQLTCAVFDAGVAPGQILSVDLPTTRGISAESFLITETTETLEDGLRWVTTLKAIEGDERGTEWDDLYKAWGKGGTSASGSASVSGGGSAPTSVGIAPYFLGATDVQGVRSATPTWTPVSGFEIELDGVALAGALVTCKVRVRAFEAGVSVRARITYWSGSAWVACGTGTVVTSTAWTADSFTVVLTGTTSRYRLELLPGTANKTVFGVGYVEAVR